MYRDDLLAHVLEEKENIGDLDLKNNAVSQLTFKALKQVFGEVKECRLGPRNNRRRAYLNLKRKDIVQRRGRVHFENEWQILRSGIDALAKEAGDWQVIENKQLNYLSCIHCENVRYDGARVLTEIMLTKNMENKKIHVSLMYDRRSVSKESMTNTFVKYNANDTSTDLVYTLYNNQLISNYSIYRFDLICTHATLGCEILYMLKWSLYRS